MAKTHSRLSFDELCEEAFGELGLHPWEFYEYSLYEFVLKRKGHIKRRKNDYQNLLVASMIPHMKKEDRARIIKQVFKEDNGKVLSLKEEYERIQKRYESITGGQELKVVNGGKRNKDNNRR